MALRLSHVLVLMALILAAGVLSVQQLEAHVGRSAVPGVVVLDAPGMSVHEAEAVMLRWPGMELEWVAAGEEPFAPFDGVAVARLRGRGWASALLTPGAPEDAALRRTWGVLVRELPAEEAPARLAGFVAEHAGMRPFLAGLSLASPPLASPPLASPPVAELLAALAPVIGAADRLSSFRRTSIVVLGQREPQSRRRLMLRLERGPRTAASQPVLRELLQGLR